MTVGVIPLDRGGLFKFGNFENRKGAAKPRPLCTPLGLFLSSARDSLFLFVDLCLYASVFSALRCADVVLFLHFLCGSLPARRLYASLLSALRCADVVLFLHFLYGSLLARCLYASILSALCVAISRFESQARGGRLLVVTLAEPRQRGEDSCCHRAHCLSEASLREWQQTGAAAEQGAQRVTTSSLPPLAVPSPTEVPQPPLPPSHPAQRRWPKTSRAATPISHNRGSHPKPQHHNIHTIRYNFKTSSV